MRKILVAIPYLHSGGVEVSLVRFLREFSKENEVSLLMLKKEGMYLKFVPNNVKIIELKYDDDIYNYEKQFKDVKKIKGIGNKLKFIFYRLKLKKCLVFNDWEHYYKTILSHVCKIGNCTFDLAIDWHGYGHFISSVVADKVQANKKAFWIHDEKNEWINKINFWLNKFDMVYCVSQACQTTLLERRPDLKEKVDIFYNIIDYNEIRKKSLEPFNFKYDNNVLNIITVGRLEWQKGYDVAVDIARRLKEKNIAFCWYVIGDGHKKNEIENLIAKNNVADCFKLLGVIANPFPYVKNANLYVLSSRHEGYCIATLEAKILGKVIIATDIPSNREQINDGENGILCNLDSEVFAEKIMQVCNDERLCNKIKTNLEKENFDFTFQFEKLYDLMER